MPRSRLSPVRWLVAAVLVAGVLPTASPPTTRAASGLGDQLFATGGEVEVQVLPATAAFTSELWLFEPGPARRIATNRDVGLVVNLGTFPAGVELLFGIRVLNTGNEFRMGPGTRNPDGIAHAVVTFLDPTRARVGFEDLYGGGDRDYDDNVFEFRGGIAPEVPKPPVADAGPDQAVSEGALVILDGRGSSDPDSTNLTYGWALVERSGPPITLSSSTSPTPVFATFDDGTYRFALTVSDGTATDTDDVLVRVTNATPVLAVQADPAYAGGVALVTASFTDAGLLDTHAGTIDWGDGSAPEAVPVSAQGSGWGSLVASHVYPEPGAYTIEITVTDDDGGAATTRVAGLPVVVPVALWSNSTAADAAMEATSGAVTVEGLTHTNDDLRLRGGPKTFRGPTEYVRTLDVGGTGATFTPPAVRTGIKDFPIRFDIADYRPGGQAAIQAGAAYRDMSGACGSDGFWQVAGSTLASGIYYATCGIKINGNPIGGTITLAAEGEIHVSGTGAFFDPFVDGLLFLSASSSASAIRVDASNSTFFGYSFAERGRIVLTGASDRFYCGILGDRIDIASRDLLIRGSGCTNPARTGAPPTLVPRLSVGLAVDRTDALPNEGLTHTATVRNDGATLVMPGVIGLENLGTEAVTVTGDDLRFEYQATVDGSWYPLPGAVTVRRWPNAAAGVAYPPGDEPIEGTEIAPGALASWGYAAVYTLDAAQVALLLDAARVAAIRNVSTFELTPPDVPVRRLFRFGDNVAPPLRSAGADATNVTVTVVPPAGDAATFDASTAPGLATLAPGASVDVVLDSAVPGPAPRSTDEGDAAYLARLAAFDRALLAGVAFARGDAAIGPVLGPSAIATTIRRLPIVGLAKRGPAEILRGSTAAYTLELANTGSAGASSLAVTDALAGVGELTVTGAPATLDPGGTATATSAYPVPPASPLTTLDDLASVSWTDAAGNAYGPVTDRLSTRVLAPRRLAVTKSALPVEGSGGSALDYEIAITNLGDEPISGVTLTDTPDPLTAIVAGSVATTQGSITTGNTAGDTAIGVDVGTLAGRTTVVVAFRVTVGAIPEGATSITNQATVTSVELGPIVSDDPLAPGATDPTVTPVGPAAGGGGGGTTGGPTVGPIAPADGTVVTAPVLLATALTPPAGEAVASWRMSAARVDAPGETTLAAGPGGAADETVAISAPFDPTLLPNGSYWITVRTTASGGGTSVATFSLIVDGNLKLGRYQTTYQDLSVPIGGIPLQVLRTYDSFDKAVGDFGVGWNLELANFRVMTNGPLGQGGWVQETANCGLIFCETTYRTTRPHVVTVVWPDGRQEIFDLAPANGSTFFAPATAAAFRARPGTTSTLAADGDASLSYFGDGNLYGGGFGSGGIYDPTRFRLTDRFGTQYLLEVGRGLVSARDRNGNTVTVSPDGITSSLGPSITFTRDQLGRITTITDPANETIGYGYDSAGDLVRVTDQDGRVASFGYAAGHYLASTGGAGAPPLRTLAYDADGRLRSITDGEGNVTALDIDVDARTQTVTGPDPRLTTILSFDERGNTRRIDELFGGRRLTTSFTYNALGLPEVSTDPLGNTSIASYDEQGNLTRLTDRDGVVTEITYTAFSQPDVVTVGAELEADYGYNEFGDLTSITYGDSSSVGFGYDESGRLTSTTDLAGASRTITYDANGYPERVIEPQGTSLLGHDPLGRLTSITDPLGGTVRYGYDTAGNLVSISDQNGNTRGYTYDALGRLQTARDPLGGTTTYGYDDAGRLETLTDRNGVVRTYTYGPDGGVTAISATDGTLVGYDYDPLGRLVRATTAGSELRRAWDDASRLGEEVLAVAGLPEVAIRRTWTAGGQLSSIEDAGGTTTFGYDGQGRLASIGDTGAGGFGLAYDAVDRLAGLTRPNGVDDVYTYLAGRLETRTSSGPAGVVDSADIDYDPLGFPERVTDLAGEHRYTTDPLGRLTGATHPGSSGIADETYAYDPAGNRTSWAGNPAASVVVDAANRLRADAIYDYIYDNEGRLVTRRDRTSGVTTTFTWNALGQLTAVAGSDGTAVGYRYDPLGRRIETTDNGTITRTVYAGRNPRLTLDAAGAVQARLVEGLGLDGILAAVDAAGTSSYPVLDPAGSVRALTDGSGAVSTTFTYDSFGRPVGGTTSFPHAWQGLTPDSTGLLAAEARTYDPATGRFLSEDPLPADNLYPYAANSPLLLSDPTGLAPLAEYGSTTGESAKRTPQVCAQGSWTASFVLDLSLDIGIQAALGQLVGQLGIYSFVEKSGQRYVGRSVDIARRLAEHLRSGKLPRGVATIDVKLLATLGDVAEDALPIAEQLVIDGCGGAKSTPGGTLSNQYNAIAKERWTALRALDTDIDELISILWP